MDARKYDASLVGALARNAHQINEEGLSVELRPVPDDERPHALDPRVYEVSKRKLETASMRPSWMSLLGVRNRPDKVTLDLAEAPVDRREILLELDDRYIDLFVWTPEGHRPGSPALVYLHGGGFTAGNVLQFANQLAFMAAKSGAVVVYPEYRLAPETAFPGQIEDCTAAVEYVIAHAGELGVDPAKIVVSGDSAGGSLANSCIQKMPAGTFAHAIEIYPAVDFGPEDPEWSFDYYPLLEEQREVAVSRINRLRESDDMVERLYVHGRTSMRDPLISAAYVDDYATWPSITIITAEFDALRYSDEKWAKKLAAAGVDTRVIRYGGCDHGFFDLFGTYPQSEDVCLLMAEKLRSLAGAAQ